VYFIGIFGRSLIEKNAGECSYYNRLILMVIVKFSSISVSDFTNARQDRRLATVAKLLGRCIWHPGVDWYDNSGMYPDWRIQSGADSRKVLVHGLRSSAIRKGFIVVVAVSELALQRYRLFFVTTGVIPFLATITASFVGCLLPMLFVLPSKYTVSQKTTMM